MIDTHTALERLIDGQDLTSDQVETLFGRLMDGELSEVHKTALLVALRMKGETAAEIAGAATAMRRRVIAISHHRPEAVDTCGTGGDGKGTFNISTAAALVAAAAGAPVAKHGNRSVSSKSGSADVLAALGVSIETVPETAGRALDEIGIAFLFAPRLHPAMKEVMPVRQALGLRTIFNVLGPLTNPAGARRQLLGVYSASLVDKVGQVLAALGSEHALVVHGSDGLDEITITGPTRVAEVRDGGVQVWDLDPTELGIELARPQDLLGGSATDNAALLRRIFAGEKGPLADITALNAGAALWVAGVAADLDAGLVAARHALKSGAASAKLDALRGFAV